MTTEAENLKKYYLEIQKSLVAQRHAIQRLSHNRKIKGDYFESIFRSYLQSVISSRFSVCRGGVFIHDALQYEYDVMIFDQTEVHPLFRNEDVAIVRPNDLRCVVQIKGLLDKDSYESAKNNLKSIKSVHNDCLGYILAYEYKIVNERTAENQIQKADLIGDMEDIDCPIDILVGLGAEGDIGLTIHKTLNIPPDSKPLNLGNDFPSVGWLVEHIKLAALYIPSRSTIKLTRT